MTPNERLVTEARFYDELMVIADKLAAENLRLRAAASILAKLFAAGGIHVVADQSECETVDSADWIPLDESELAYLAALTSESS